MNIAGTTSDSRSISPSLWRSFIRSDNWSPKKHGGTSHVQLSEITVLRRHV